MVGHHSLPCCLGGSLQHVTLFLYLSTISNALPPHPRTLTLIGCQTVLAAFKTKCSRFQTNIAATNIIKDDANKGAYDSADEQYVRTWAHVRVMCVCKGQCEGMSGSCVCKGQSKNLVTVAPTAAGGQVGQTRASVGFIATAGM